MSPRTTPVPRMSIECKPGQKERWREAAAANGERFGAQFVRWMLDEYAAGRMLHISPAFLEFGRVIGIVMGEQAAKTLAQIQIAYLENVERKP